MARNFGVPWEAIHLNSLKESPLTTPELDDPDVVAALGEQIRDLKPALVIIDTITYATGRNMGRSWEAEAAFDAILQVAAETGVPILALIHLNKEGEALNRRITERARSVLSLTCPDPDGQPDRRRHWVSKSAVKKPLALGITLHDDRNDYDDRPPTVPGPEHKPRGKAPAKSEADAEWLWNFLRSRGPCRMVQIIEAAREAGWLAMPTDDKPDPSISPLSNAKDRIPKLHPGYRVEQFEEFDPDGGRAYKHWKIVDQSGAMLIDPNEGLEELRFIRRKRTLS